MQLLIVYATVEGHTAKIARRVAQQVEAEGHQVELIDLRDVGFGLPGVADAVIVCAPIHAGDYPEPVRAFAHDFNATLNQKPSALITVSLAITSEYEDERIEAQAYAYKLAEQTGWAPGMHHDAAGAMKFLETSFFKRWAMRRIATHVDKSVDPKRDYELTDWGALATFVEDFLSTLGRPA